LSFHVVAYNEPGSETEESPEMETNDDITKKTEPPILEDPSPRCVLEIPISGTDSDHSSSSSCSSGSTEKLVPERTGILRESNGIQWKQILDSFKKKSARRFSVIPLISTYETIARKNLRRKLARIQHSADVFIDCEGIMAPKPSWRNFDYLELEAATDNFSSGEPFFGIFNFSHTHTYLPAYIIFFSFLCLLSLSLQCTTLIPGLIVLPISTS
jgi:hypothetical protein